MPNPSSHHEGIRVVDMSWNSERVCEQIHLLKGSRALRELGQDQDVIIVFFDNVYGKWYN